RDAMFLLRQDLDLMQSLLKTYPAKNLVLVREPKWASEPKGRLRAQDCRDLDDAAAARAYLRLHEQLIEDWRFFIQEETRYLVAIDLNISMHGRAAYEK